MSFESEFAAESANAIKAAQEVVRVTAISLFSGIINASPVGNPSLWENPNPPANYVGGAFRSNWFLSINNPSNEVTKSTRGKQQRLNDVIKIATDEYSSSYWLTNNLPYAGAIEAGHSTQAPNGVIAPQQVLVNSKIKRFERAANKKYNTE